MASRKHHYVPCFYLRRWAGSDGRVCEFSRPHRVVVPRRTHPEGTAYEIDLYKDDALPTGFESWLEDYFFGRVDQLASDAHQLLLKDQLALLTPGMRSAWSRFIISLLQRNPEKIAWLKERWKIEYARALEGIRAEYETRRQPADPETFDEFRDRVRMDMGARQLRGMIDLKQTGLVINMMAWHTVTFAGLRHPLLTSDRPVIMTNGLGYDHSHIVLPISPTQMFVAVRSSNTEKEIKAIPPVELAFRANDRIASQAMRFVYGIDDMQLRFVENRLGHGEPQFVGAYSDDEDCTSDE
jgi:hypothetical protein